MFKLKATQHLKVNEENVREGENDFGLSASAKSECQTYVELNLFDNQTLWNPHYASLNVKAHSLNIIYINKHLDILENLHFSLSCES